MCLRRFCFINLTLLLFANIKIAASENWRHNILQHLSNVNLKPIAILHPDDGNANEQSEINTANAITPDTYSIDPPYNQKAYLLYYALRTTEENEDLDPEAAKTFDTTKGILRKAIRNRCNQLKSCVKKCPRKKKLLKCTIQCKETYDDYNVCEKKRCSKPKCGKTLPPSWLLLRNN